MPIAIEEFLRAYSPLTMAPEIVKETTVCGCPVKLCNMVLLSFPAANRNPAMFLDADKVADRSQGKSAFCRRPRHSPRVAFNPAHGDDGRNRGVAQAHSRFRSRSGRQGPMVGRHGARAAPASDPVWQGIPRRGEGNVK
jgi:hypothetical protein